MAAKFELYKTDQYRFRLKAANGEKLLASEGYASKAGAEDGIDAVMINAPLDGRFHKRISSSGSPYFVLKGANGETIGTSELYSSVSAMAKGIAAVKREAPGAPTDDQT